MFAQIVSKIHVFIIIMANINAPSYIECLESVVLMDIGFLGTMTVCLFVSESADRTLGLYNAAAYFDKMPLPIRLESRIMLANVY